MRAHVILVHAIHGPSEKSSLGGYDFETLVDRYPLTPGRPDPLVAQSDLPIRFARLEFKVVRYDGDEVILMIDPRICDQQFRAAII